MPSKPNFKLRLYIRGSTLAGSRSLTNLEQFYAEYLPGRHSIDVIDLDRDPSRAHTEPIPHGLSSSVSHLIAPAMSL